MNPLLYYPSFEVRNQDWLKFALLYLKDIKIIIPEEGESKLSKEFWDIYKSTNLFGFHRPKPREGYDSSIETIESIEPILKNPKLYSKRFNINSKTETVVDKWRNPNNQKFEIFRAKYSDQFMDYCLHNKFAIQSPNGIFLPQELALIFMSLLAKVIGKETERSPITDIEKFDYLTTEIANPSENEKKLILAQNIVNVKIPRNIDGIDIEDVLKLRTTKGFIENLNAFHIALDSFHTNTENGNLTQDFLAEYENPFKGITEDVKRLSLDLASYGIGTYMTLTNETIEIPAFIKTIIIGGLTLYTGNKIKTKKIWQNSKNRFLVRRYLTGLENTPHNTRYSQ